MNEQSCPLSSAGATVFNYKKYGPDTFLESHIHSSRISCLFFQTDRDPSYDTWKWVLLLTVMPYQSQLPFPWHWILHAILQNEHHLVQTELRVFREEYVSPQEQAPNYMLIHHLRQILVAQSLYSWSPVPLIFKLYYNLPTDKDIHSNVLNTLQ